MESSRIFIKGLPPSLGVEDFKKHFSMHSAITDAKLIPHRRIGYVGYKTPQDAEKAIKYHNKTFIRMSRIAVELARSVEHQHALRPSFNSTNGSKRKYAEIQDEVSSGFVTDGNKKRKYRDLAKEKNEAKLREFLEVMQPPSKSKTWGNQDPVDMRAPTATYLPALDAEAATDLPDDTHDEAVIKKQKNKQEPEHTHDLAAKVRQPTDINHQDKDDNADNDVGLHSDQVCEEATRKPIHHSSTVSDADWLRSRTSRLLGLADDGPVEPVTLPGGDPEENRETSVSLAQERHKHTSNASVQTHVEAEAKEVAGPAPRPQGIEDSSTGNGRLFVRNLTYTATGEDLRRFFESEDQGTIEEVHLPLDPRTGQNKGFAHIQYVEPEAANRALQNLDQKPFQGRLLHLMPADAKRENGLDEFTISKLPLKKQQQIRRKAEAASSTFNWNAMYMNADAIMSSISNRLGVAKSEILDPTSSSAAVKQAHAETHVIQETKSYFTNHGVDLDAFKTKERGETAILVKNFPYATTSEELKKLFEAHGHITKLLMPPSGTIAIIQYDQPDHARSAFGSLAYRKFKESILFLEKAPKGLFDPTKTKPNTQELERTKAQIVKPSATELLEGDDTQQIVNSSTLFVRNLSFLTTTDRLREVFQPLGGFISAVVKMKPHPKRSRQLLSMGFGFLEFRSKDDAQAALAAMDGYKLDGHELLIRFSHKAVDAAEERRKEDQAKKISGRKTKIIVKNLPFEASKSDIRSLFGSYGQLRSVRVPKRFDNSTRGFAFADFVTAREAENAMDALRDTHLLGRRLVLEFAAEDAVDPEQEIENMQQKVGKQADKVALQRLTGSGRKKFNVEDQG